ncbi:MAG: erg24, C-14 sterol reductase [Chrysothrix sp. TS-e1954]|nr:MAG: erg24, C-14 sterol reductase [Chrysothrix sp. TS-e1954]
MATKGSKSQSSFHGYEFFGPPGALFIAIFLPLTCYAFLFLCNDVSGCPAPSLLHPTRLTLSKLAEEVNWPGISGLFDAKVFLAVLGYYAFSLLLFVVLPAQEIEGVQLANGNRLKYRMNAFSSSLLTLTILAAGTLAQGVNGSPVWTFIWDNYIQLLTSSVIISYSLATFVYIRSFSTPQRGAPNPLNRELAGGGTSGNMLYDWFIGRELNPRITLPFAGIIDIKAFMELRPGMLGWIILNLTFLARQYSNYGYITISMLITVLSQAIYVLDALYMESAILTTIDITTDGFGFMLAFGDLTWLPFVYSLQARYLAVHPVELGAAGIAGIFAVAGTGYFIFRSANNEKNRFRTNPADPAVAHLEYIQTKTGSRLLASGWWGRARHINYLGDWIMSWAYCLPTGLAGYVIQPSSPFRDHAPKGGHLIVDDYSLRGGVEVVPGDARGWGMVVTYFFMLYFAVLLVHRERRDEEKCKRKYGKDWEEYCRRVPSRILPGIY